MAHSKSAEKRIRQIEKRTAQNRMRLSRVRTFIRKVEEAISSGDKSAAQEALRKAQPEIQRGANKGVLHRNMADRKVSRLAARVNAL